MSDGERRLWRAVLGQAYEDAEMLAPGDGIAPEPFECARARRYLRADSSHEKENLELVCEFADVPADRVYLWARQHYPLKSESTVLAPPATAAAQPQEHQPGYRTPQIAGWQQPTAQA